LEATIFDFLSETMRIPIKRRWYPIVETDKCHNPLKFFKELAGLRFFRAFYYYSRSFLVP
jgi:hypothetical protein